MSILKKRIRPRSNSAFIPSEIRKSLTGFTLVEVLLALTIFAFIGLGLAMSFFSGMKLWSRAASGDIWRNDTIFSLEMVARELRQSIDIPAIGFRGDAKGFSFPAVSGYDVIMATYSFNDADKALVRSESLMKDLIAEKLVNNAVGKKVLALDEFSAQYLKVDQVSKSLEWKDEWKKEDGIFAAVRIKGKSHNEELQKTIFVPISQ